MKFMRLLLFAYSLIILSVSSAWGQYPQKIHYTKKEVMVPMRDGVKLFTRIYTPDSMRGPLPILLMRSPYGDWNIGTITPEKDPYVFNLADEGYIFVYQNIRGKQKSEGDFIMEGAFSKNDRTVIDEASDTYDLIDWLLKNTNSTGKVGQLGISYPGELALISAVKPHPALKAVSPQGTVADFFLGDDFFHNGAFRLSFGFEYSYGEEVSKGDSLFPFSMYDLYPWYLNLGPLSNVNKKYFHHDIPTWNDFIKHPNYDSYWANKAPVRYSDTPLVPILHVGGYWDQENMNGPEALYAKMEQYDFHNLNYLVLGPWCHGQWGDSDASSIGIYCDGRNTGNDFREIQKEWFDYWLKGIGDGKFPEAECYQTGSNIWKKYDTWPDKAAKTTKLYLVDGKKLSFQRPSDNTPKFDSYVSDPENPVVYRQRPIESTYSDSSNWESWLAEDQRLVDHRPDVLCYETDTLTADVTITGNVMADIFASISGSDADWVVKLIDVNPDLCKKHLDMSQSELMIAGDIFRGRYRKSFSKPEPITPGKVEEYKFSLHQVNHVFKKGHRIMVQVQSSWFPIFDRNPQKFVPNIFLATEKDYIKSTQEIYRTKQYASCIELPLVPDSTAKITAR
jgi:putative CocE/NonD family hydrolase